MRGKADANQQEIVKTLRKLGAKVHILSKYPGQLDLLVGYNKKLYWFEVKDGNKCKSAQKLTESELAIFQEWAEFAEAGIIAVVRNAEEALDIIRRVHV